MFSDAFSEESSEVCELWPVKFWMFVFQLQQFDLVVFNWKMLVKHHLGESPPDRRQQTRQSFMIGKTWVYQGSTKHNSLLQLNFLVSLLLASREAPHAAKKLCWAVVAYGTMGATTRTLEQTYVIIYRSLSKENHGCSTAILDHDLWYHHPSARLVYVLVEIVCG